MSSRVAKWGGCALALTSVIGLVLYLSHVGLDKADQLSSVLGMFAGLAGLGLAIAGFVTGRRGPTSTSAVPPTSPPAPEAGPAPRGEVRNEISGGTFHGPVMQGHDFKLTGRPETDDEIP